MLLIHLIRMERERMTSFLGLLKKDAKVSWIWLAVWLCGMICWAFAAHIIAARQKEPLVIFGFLRQWGFSISCSAAFYVLSPS